MALADGNIDISNRYAWAENAGWLNFAPAFDEVAVHFDGCRGYLTGHAWGENIGWIKLGTDGGGPYGNTSAIDWGVNTDANGRLSGYAFSKNVGWFNFSPTNQPVVVDTNTGEFDGYAWGENVGWVHFKGTAPPYNVRTVAFDTQPQGTPNWWLAHYGVGESDDEGDGVSAWREYVADTCPTNAASCFAITSISNRSPRVVCFVSSSNRQYTLQYTTDLPGGHWTDVAGQAGIRGKGGPDTLRDANPISDRCYRVLVGVP